MATVGGSGGGRAGAPLSARPPGIQALRCINSTGCQHQSTALNLTHAPSTAGLLAAR